MTEQLKGLHTRLHPAKIGPGEAQTLSGFVPRIDGSLARRKGFDPTGNAATATATFNGLTHYKRVLESDGQIIGIGNDGQSRSFDV